jgi:hypothetical protein
VPASPSTTLPPAARRLSAVARLPEWALDCTAVALITAATWAIFTRAFLNYDTLYALIWGRDLAHGRTPDYDVTLAPTPHPLAEAVGGLASLLGTEGGYTVMLAAALLSFGALVWAVFRLGERCFSWPVGALAAFVVATREPFLSQGVRAYVDVPFLALVVIAAVLEAGRPRRGTPVLVLLALAGLLRPEAWLLAVAYWLYLVPRLDTTARIRLGALALAAPVLWALSDLAITGDPAHSLTATRDTAETLGRPRGVLKVPEIMPRRLGEILRWVPLIGGTAGFFAGLYLERRRSMIPAALCVLSGIGFVIIGLAGLSLLGRYLLLPAAMLAIFFGFASLWWLDLPRGPARRRWTIAGAVLLVAFFGSTATHQRDKLESLRDGIQLRGRIQDDLRDLARDQPSASLLERCGPIYVPNHRPVPVLAYYLDRDPDQIVSAQLERPKRGVFVAPATEVVRNKFVLDPRDPKKFQVPSRLPGFVRVAGDTSWNVFARGCGGHG